MSENSGNFAVTRRNFLRAGAVLAGLGLTGLIGVPLEAAAATWTVTKVGSFDELPVQGIYLDCSKLDLKSADITASGDIWLGTFGGIYGLFLPFDPTQNRSWSGTAKLLWSSVGIDSDGTPLDLELTMSDAHTRKHAGVSPDPSCKQNLLLSASSTHYPWLYSRRYSTAGEMNNGVATGVRVHVRFLRHGTSELARGGYLFAMRDIDVVNPSDPDYAESIRLTDGHDGSIYVTHDTKLDVDTDTGWVRATMADDTHVDPRMSAAFITASDFTLEWHGAPTCGSRLFDTLISKGAATVHKDPRWESWL